VQAIAAVCGLPTKPYDRYNLPPERARIVAWSIRSLDDDASASVALGMYGTLPQPQRTPRWVTPTSVLQETIVQLVFWNWAASSAFFYSELRTSLQLHENEDLVIGWPEYGFSSIPSSNFVKEVEISKGSSGSRYTLTSAQGVIIKHELLFVLNIQITHCARSSKQVLIETHAASFEVDFDCRLDRESSFKQQQPDRLAYWKSEC